MGYDERYERLDRARKSSVQTPTGSLRTVNYREDRYKTPASRLKTSVVTTFLATAIVATSMFLGITKIPERIEEIEAINSALSSYETIVSDNTYRTADNQNYWYSASGIANEILSSEDKDLAIYSVYKNVSVNRTNNMNEIFSEMDRLIGSSKEPSLDLQQYRNYDGYLRSLGCVDENGNISEKMYREKMDEYAASIGRVEKSEGTSFNTR